MEYCGPRALALDAFLAWPQRSQDAALQWLTREKRRCSSCGTDPVEWAEDPRAYHAHVSGQCPGCLAKHRLEESLKKGAKKDSTGLEPGEQVVLPLQHAADCPRCAPRTRTGRR